MKKLVLLLAVVFSVSLFSCGGAKPKAAATDSDSVAAPVDTVAVANDSTDTAAVANDSVAPVANDSVK